VTTPKFRCLIAACAVTSVVVFPAVVFGLALRHFAGPGPLLPWRFPVFSLFALAQFPLVRLVAQWSLRWPWEDHRAVDLTFTANEPAMIPAGSIFENEHGDRYESVEDVKVPAGTSKHRFIVKKVRPGSKKPGVKEVAHA